VWAKDIDLLGNKTSEYLTYDSKSGYETFAFKNIGKSLAANKIFSKNDIELYNMYSRYGYIPLYTNEQVCREYLFFTKPDLNIFGDGKSSLVRYDAELNKSLADIPFFTEANIRNGNALRQLQYSVMDNHPTKSAQNPFMYLLSNTVSSKLDLPSISAETRESTANIMGTSLQYRGHSYKSDNGYDFSLSFTDTAYLDVYTLVKAYDEYIRLLKTGENDLRPMRRYIISRIVSEQFSIYKFLIGEDGETILFYAKLTGCYFTDVPRSDMSDPGNDGFKYSVSFHAQFVEDSNPIILSEFNRISPSRLSNTYADVNTYDIDNAVVDNTWVRWPKIVAVESSTDLRVKRRGTNKDYRMKWFK
jgi:hypothetical protein